MQYVKYYSDKDSSHIMKRNHFLDILKGMCALFITATHYDFTDWNRLDYFFPFWIDMAVPIFMLISGYVATVSYRRRNVTTIEQAYELPTLVGKLVRYSLPFFVAYVIELIINIKLHVFQGVSIPMLIVYFIKGGEGPGAFYFPLLIQLVFVFPLIYFLIERQGFFGLLVAFLGTYAMEVMKGIFQMGENTYCLLLFRYTFIIAVGVYLASSHYKPRTWWAIASLVFGFAFILFSSYYGLYIQYIDYWKGTSLFGCLFIAPIVGFGVTRLQNWHFAPLELLGKASYYIFLTQKVYYSHGRQIYLRIPGEKYDFLVTMVICIVAGVLFYAVVEPVNTRVCRVCKAFVERHPIPETWR